MQLFVIENKNRDSLSGFGISLNFDCDVVQASAAMMEFSSHLNNTSFEIPPKTL